MYRLIRTLSVALAVLVASPARADTVIGRVSAVTGGDTFQVIVGDSGRVLSVRLAGIVAPGAGHPAAGRAQQGLAAHLFGREVGLDGRWRDGRWLATARVAAADCLAATCPRTVDPALEQLRAGLAWWDGRDGGMLAADERIGYEQAEFQAKIHRLGLWAGRQTLPPWSRAPR